METQALGVPWPWAAFGRNKINRIQPVRAGRWKVSGMEMLCAQFHAGDAVGGPWQKCRLLGLWVNLHWNCG